MIVFENIREGIKSIKGNLLRTTLTALIVAIGISSLVGILTAIEGIRASVGQSFSSLGANAFDIRSKREDFSSSQRGKKAKVYPPISFKEAQTFVENYEVRSTISIAAGVSFNAIAKRLSKKTNPNTRVLAVNENYLAVNARNLSSGRNFTPFEIQMGSPVCLIGQEIYENLFESGIPLNEEINVLGNKFRVIGVLEKQGGIAGGNSMDRSILLPLNYALRLGNIGKPNFSLKISIPDPSQIEYAMGEANGLMRSVRQDILGQEDSFELSMSQSLAESLNEITGYLRMGGFVIGFITLLGASIGLLNIMMVSVTERTREIGVRKALGATPKLIRQQFLVEALVICFIGGIGGILFGVVFGNVVGIVIGEGGFIFPWIWILLGLVVCFIVGVASGYYPAKKAAKLDPIESLRFE